MMTTLEKPVDVREIWTSAAGSPELSSHLQPRADDTLFSVIYTLNLTGLDTGEGHHGCSKSISSSSQTMVSPSMCQWLENERSIPRVRNHDSGPIDPAISWHTGS